MEIKRIYRIILSTFLFIVLISAGGCIQHRYLYNVGLDGRCEFEYRAQGDSLDIYDPEGTYPTAPFYAISTSTEVDTAGNESHVLVARANFRGDSLPRSLGLKEVPWTEVFLQHPTELGQTRLFFASLYHFNQQFQGRRRSEIQGVRWDYIPEECHILETDADTLLSEAERMVLEEKYAAGLLVWNTERYKLRTREILHRTLAMYPGIDVPQQWVDSALVEADSVIHAYASGISAVELDLVNLEWWNDLRPAIENVLIENLNHFGDSTLLAEIPRIGELLELRHLVTEDLTDETFEVRADLPGRVLSDNSMAMEEGVLIWKFDGEELVEDDILLKATSLYLYPARIVGFLILLAALIIGIKFRKKTPDSVMPDAGEIKAKHDTIPPTGHG